MKKLFAAVLMVCATGAMAAEPDMAKYNKSCAVCHASGAAGAPKTGDAAAWEPHLAKGMDTLLKHVNDGFNAMPPRGMCFDCTEDDYRALIEYMVKPAE